MPTFLQRYHSETTWSGKAIVMEIFHLAMISQDKKWTISQTANDFECSIGLVSENLRLANAIHKDEKLLTCSSRQEALRKLGHEQAYRKT